MSQKLDAIERTFFNKLFVSMAEEMGVTLARTAYSPNIKERKDFSCAIFTPGGRLLAQAAHIPVHLGAMPLSVQSVLQRCPEMNPGDCYIVNDPLLEERICQILLSCPRYSMGIISRVISLPERTMRM